MASVLPTKHRAEVTAMIKESDARKRIVLCKDRDQYTGKGIEFHTHRVRIPDYTIPEQWLTDEVFNNELYQEVIKAGSIGGYIAHCGGAYTQEDVTQALMIARLNRDPSFSFLIEYKIKDKKTGAMIPFILNYAQYVTLRELEGMRMAGVPIRLIIVKARQWGGSTLVDLYISWIQMHVKEGWYAVIIAQTKDTARRIRAMYEKALDAMPGFIYGVGRLQFSPYGKTGADSIITDSKGKVVRDNVITVASYENFEATRGADYAMAHFSEVAYWRTTKSKSADEVITNIDSNITLEPCTVEVFESTANGQTGYLYDEYQLAKAGKSIRKALFIPYRYIANDMLAFRDGKEKRDFACWLIDNKDNTVAPDETSEPGAWLYGQFEKGATLEHIHWYVLKRKSFHDHGSMAQEVPSDDIECFVYSGNNVFSPYIVDMLRQEHVCAAPFVGSIATSGKDGHLYFKKEANGLLRAWRLPDSSETSHQYIVSVDLGGRTEASDFSCITVIDRIAKLAPGGRLEVVARWHGHVRYDAVARLAVKIARYYKDALLVIESNSFDRKKADATQFVEQGDHIRGVLEVIGDEYPNLYCRPATSPEDIRNGVYTKKGFQTNSKTKQEMVDWFVPLFEDNLFIDHDEMLYHEASIYEQKTSGGYGNKEGKNNHDDVIMTDMIACLVEKDMPAPSFVKHYDEAEDGGYLGTRNESSF